jgi:hypothetical protein
MVLGMDGALPGPWTPLLFTPFMVWHFWLWLLIGVFSLEARQFPVRLTPYYIKAFLKDGK